MKRPNITLGEWESTEDGDIYRRPIKELYEYGGGVAGDHPIATAYKGHRSWENRFNHKANAQAISAVPDMIDALLDAYQAIDSLDDEALGIKTIRDVNGDPEPQPIKWELMYNIQQALKKAGCTDD